MVKLKFKDRLVVSAFGFNVATIISCIINILIWPSLIISTVFLGVAVILSMKEEEE